MSNNETSKKFSGNSEDSATGEEKRKREISLAVSAQARSWYPRVRRRIDMTTNGQYKLHYWLAEVRRPTELQTGPEIPGLLDVIGFNTDVEAAVAASVICRVFEQAILPMRGTVSANRMRKKLKMSEPKMTKGLPQVHDLLIERQINIYGMSRPDLFYNESLARFAQACVKDFIMHVELHRKGCPLPQWTPELQESINLYNHKALSWDRFYPPGMEPPLKQKIPLRRKGSEGNEVRNAKESWMELECRCDECKKLVVLRWDFDPGVCICNATDPILLVDN